MEILVDDQAVSVHRGRSKFGNAFGALAQFVFQVVRSQIFEQNLPCRNAGLVDLLVKAQPLYLCPCGVLGFEVVHQANDGLVLDPFPVGLSRDVEAQHPGRSLLAIFFLEASSLKHFYPFVSDAEDRRRNFASEGAAMASAISLSLKRHCLRWPEPSGCAGIWPLRAKPIR